MDRPGPGRDAAGIMSHMSRVIAEKLLVLVQGASTAATAYLLTLLAAAATTRRTGSHKAGGKSLRFVIIMPAHNEESVIAESLAALQRLDYPPEGFEVVVVADNCEDQTATLASAAGAVVYERNDPARPGKGEALVWALERLEADGRRPDAIAFVDADCVVSANFLDAVDARLASGARAVQVAYEAANPGASWTAALRYAGFGLINVVRPLGKSKLGLSCGLFGSGMAFSRPLLEEHPWRATSLTEDVEYHLRLVLAGECVAFAPEASVVSPMPTSQAESHEQRMRWEAGKWHLVRTWTPPLVREGLRRRRVDPLHAALELLVPGQSLLLAAVSGSGIAAAALGSRRALKLAAGNFAAQAAYIVLGLRKIGAPASVYRALAWAPVAMANTLGVQGRILAGRGPRSWVRTARAQSMEMGAHAKLSTDPVGGRLRVTLRRALAIPGLMACGFFD